MAERSRKRGIALNLSFFSALSEPRPPVLNSDAKDTAKSPRTFEREGVGLGIVAAMNDSVNGFDDATIYSSKATRTAILAVSPRSQPIPISFSSSVKSIGKIEAEPEQNPIGDFFLEKDEMELSEGYTCVISNLGNNLIKKREYYNDQIVVNCVTSGFVMKSGIFSASHGKDYSSIMPSRTDDFLNSCDLCKKTLHGRDIFIYRGEKAFCSAECRSSALFDRSSSSCSTSPMRMFTEVAAA